MESFAEELKGLIEAWRGLFGTTDEDIIDAMMDEIDRLDPADDDD